MAFHFRDSLFPAILRIFPAPKSGRQLHGTQGSVSSVRFGFEPAHIRVAIYEGPACRLQRAPSHVQWHIRWRYNSRFRNAGTYSQRHSPSFDRRENPHLSSLGPRDGQSAGISHYEHNLFRHRMRNDLKELAREVGVSPFAVVGIGVETIKGIPCF